MRSDRSILRRVFLRSRYLATATGLGKRLNSPLYNQLSRYGTTTATNVETADDKVKEKKNEWFTLPPFNPTIDGSSLGKAISDCQHKTIDNVAGATSMTALKWVLRCCPELPRSLVHKLFRLRQVRRESPDARLEKRNLKRVTAKDSMRIGDQIHLPMTVKEVPARETDEFVYSEEEMKFLHSLEVYKDPAILVINKPPGMAVQGGDGIRTSLDELAAKYLRYNSPESPRLVHRLDRDCSGVLVMGRSQLSASILHSIFREKTSRAPNADLQSRRGIMRKRYWALVIGSPRRSQGLISVPLGKVVVDEGKSERITVIDNIESSLAQYAVTEYRVIGSSSNGYTWLELCPVTGRKHQLRVHCAEVLGTPIVGDYKYGWQAHKKLKHLCCSPQPRDLQEKATKLKLNPFGLDLERGSITDKQPCLHLHCKEMVLPNISVILQHAESNTDCKLAEVESIKLDAPLPLHMQRSWDLLSS